MGKHLTQNINGNLETKLYLLIRKEKKESLKGNSFPKKILNISN
jgi:hypothetical protein